MKLLKYLSKMPCIQNYLNNYTILKIRISKIRISKIRISKIRISKIRISKNQNVKLSNKNSFK